MWWSSRLNLAELYCTNALTGNVQLQSKIEKKTKQNKKRKNEREKGRKEERKATET